MFYQNRKNYTYTEAIDVSNLNHTQNVYYPIVVDTEFEHVVLKIDKEITPQLQKTITVQAKHINDVSEGYIYSHPDCRVIARHPVMEDWLPIQLLKEQGYDVKVGTYDTDVPFSSFVHTDLYFHFGLAELYRLSPNQACPFLQAIDKIILNPTKGKGNSITHKRRLLAENNLRGSIKEGYIQIPKMWVEINGQRRGVKISFNDSVAIAGNQSLNHLAKLAGIELEDKEIFSSDEKSRMIEQYINRPEDFDNYALGDLKVYEIIKALEDKFKEVYKFLGNENYYNDESLRGTIGATTARIFEAKLLENTKLEKKDLIKLTEYGTSSKLKQSNETDKYLAKVDGGRCRNNRPTSVSSNNPICDIDISGCYGEGLRNQIYPLGRPISVGYPVDSKINSYDTLDKWHKKYKDELVPGLWVARIITKSELKYGQDFFSSWFPPKNLNDLVTDTELEEIDWWTEDNIGLTKIFRNEIHLGVLTHDGLQWIEHICSPRQRKELLEKIEVVSFIYYPKSQRKETVEEVVKALKQHKGKNTRNIIKNAKHSVDEECHAWVGFNLGELIVTELLIERKKHPKKTPFNELFKLIINTLYGDQVSPYFWVGNVVVGNNITARARTLAWYMEKGFHTFQTITDGGQFETNKVITKDRTRITGETVLELEAKGSDCCDVKFNSLSFENNKDLALNAWKHLQELFPKVDVLHAETFDIYGNKRNGQYEFEVKSIYLEGSFHGTANYSLINESSSEYKMRSYRKDDKKGYGLDDSNNVVIIKDSYHPVRFFLDQLRNNPEKVERGLVFMESRILKPAPYKARYEKFQNCDIRPGWNYEYPRLLRECTLSQFLFRTKKQWDGWENEQKKLLDKFGQSYEMFFLNSDGTLNYVKMIREIDKAVRAGKTSYLGRSLSKYLKEESNRLKPHPALNTLLKIKECMGYRYGFDIGEYEECDSCG